jgi:hypothetical protein
MSRKAQRQLREALTSISYPYLRPPSHTCRAEDIITLEGSPQSTPCSTPAELPVIHEPMPIHFTGIVDPSLTCSLPEYNIAPEFHIASAAMAIMYPAGYEFAGGSGGGSGSGSGGGGSGGDPDPD